jgi:hypothetical protein
MIRHDPTRSPSPRAALLLPAGLLALFGMSLAAGVSRPAALAAAGGERVEDLDRDGLPDAQERVVGTIAREIDSDGDGFSDAEEFARHSSPRAANSIPAPRTIDVGISAHSRRGALHVLVMVYAADGTLKNKNMTLQALVGEQVFEVSGKFLAQRARFESQPAREPGARLFSIDFEIHPKFVYTVGQVSFGASVSAPSSGEQGIADVLDLVVVEDTICVSIGSVELGLERSSSSSTNTPAGSSTSSTQMGGVYVPIYVADRAGSRGDPPGSTSSPGQVCLQRSRVVGSGGGMIVSEIVAAECVEGWDGFCGAACAAQVGSTVRSVDPVTFTGG